MRVIKGIPGLILREGVWHIEDEASLAFWNVVNSSMGRTHAFDGRRGTGTQGLREARTTQRNAPRQTFCAFAIVHRAESRWFGVPAKPRSAACASPVFFTLRRMTWQSAFAPVRCHAACEPRRPLDHRALPTAGVDPELTIVTVRCRDVRWKPHSCSHWCAVAPRTPAILMAWWLVCPGCPGLLLRPP